MQCPELMVIIGDTDADSDDDDEEEVVFDFSSLSRPVIVMMIRFIFSSEGLHQKAPPVHLCARLETKERIRACHDDTISLLI